MKKSWLIQRMKKPVGRDNIFAFGCGGSGFGKDNARQLAKICSWDYMGAAEYEFGAPAKSLNRMIDNKAILEAGAFRVFHKGHKSKVFYLCPKEDVKEIKKRVCEWAGNYTGRDTRDAVLLNEAILGVGSKYSLCCGWFDIENDFMFFTDEVMWRKFCEGLSVQVPSKKAMSKI